MKIIKDQYQITYKMIKKPYKYCKILVKNK